MRACGAACLILLCAGHLIGETEYEIKSHRARIQIFPGANAVLCSDTLLVRRTGLPKDWATMTLRLLPVYSVDYITVKGRRTETKKSREGFELRGLPSDSMLEITLTYSGRMAFRSEFSHLGPDRALFRDAELLPAGGRALEFVRLSLIVPSGWEAVSVGKLVRRETRGDSALFVYEFAKPISELGWICAGRFFTQEEGGTSVLLFSEDSSSAPAVLSLARDVLKFYGERFIPFRFPLLTIVEIEDWVAGPGVLAIGEPGIVMVKKLAFTTADRFNQAASVLPHEIAHQWWPATVFIEDQDAAFLSEGMCEYSAVLYAESRGSMTLRDSLSRHPLLRPLMMRIEQGRDLPLQQKADLRSLPTHYLKASYVHHMLRRMLGDSVFAELYRQYAARFEGKLASLDDFRKTAEELAGKNLGWFFDQWVKKKGVPQIKIYNVKSMPDSSGGWTTRGRVRLLGYEKYTAQVEVGVREPEQLRKRKVFLGADSMGVYRNDVPFEIHTSEKPVRAELDPGGDVLRIRKLPPKLSDLRDPSDGVFIVGGLRDRDYLLALARKDSAAMERSGWSITIRSDSNVTLTDLQRERIVLYGTASQNRVSAQLQGKFPMGVAPTGSISVGGETLTDSSLALIQIITNPFIPQGLIARIEPLSTLSQPELIPFDVSWTLVRGKDEISSGTWNVKDDDSVVDIR